MAQMTAVQVSKPGSLEVIKKEIPHPSRDQVRIQVKACGICHSDIFVRDNLWPGLQLPRIPGHEVAGIIDEVGENVTAWKKGDRVGVGWAGVRCNQCEACREGDFICCTKQQVTGINYDGGYEQFMIAPKEAIALIPNEISFEEAAPLLCAGVTTYNALRNSGARAGDLVAIAGIGGLGHLGIQFANKMGFKTIALSQGADKEKLARQLGAHQYIDTKVEEVGQALQKLGGARVILSTIPHAKAVSPLMKGLGHLGKLVIVGAPLEPIEVLPIDLIRQKCGIEGWASGTAKDSEDTMNFCALTGIRPMIEKFPLESANEAYDKMISNQARFRVVLIN